MSIISLKLPKLLLRLPVSLVDTYRAKSMRSHMELQHAKAPFPTLLSSSTHFKPWLIPQQSSSESHRLEGQRLLAEA